MMLDNDKRFMPQGVINNNINKKPDIVIPYAVSDFRMTTFKDVGCFAAGTFKQVGEDLLKLERDKYVCSYDVNAAMRKKEAEMRQTAEKYHPQFLAVSKELDAFKKRYAHIFRNGESRNSINIEVGFLDIFAGRSEADVAERYYLRHKNVYDRLEELQKRYYELLKCSKQGLEQRISKEMTKIRENSKTSAENGRIKWEENRTKQRKDLFNKLAFMQGYAFFIRDLNISVSGSVCRISGSKANINTPYQFTRFNETLINKQIQIIR